MSGSFWSFLIISVVVIVTPGPDTVVTIRNTLLGGRTAGIFTTLGVSTGQMIWASATSAGLVAILLASEAAFNVIRLAGAAYLVWLGAQAIIGALRSDKTLAPDAAVSTLPRLDPAAAYRQGVISDLGNPKMAVFFASVLPQFATPGEGMLSALVLLGLVFAALTFAWLALYAAAVATAGNWFRHVGVRRALESVMGAVLIALGVRLAAEQR